MSYSLILPRAPGSSHLSETQSVSSSSSAPSHSSVPPILASSLPAVASSSGTVTVYRPFQEEQTSLMDVDRTTEVVFECTISPQAPQECQDYIKRCMDTACEAYKARSQQLDLQERIIIHLTLEKAATKFGRGAVREFRYFDVKSVHDNISQKGLEPYKLPKETTFPTDKQPIFATKITDKGARYEFVWEKVYCSANGIFSTQPQHWNFCLQFPEVKDVVGFVRQPPKPKQSDCRDELDELRKIIYELEKAVEQCRAKNFPEQAETIRQQLESIRAEAKKLEEQLKPEPVKEIFSVTDVTKTQHRALIQHQFRVKVRTDCFLLNPIQQCARALTQWNAEFLRNDYQGIDFWVVKKTAPCNFGDAALQYAASEDAALQYLKAEGWIQSAKSLSTNEFTKVELTNIHSKHGPYHCTLSVTLNKIRVLVNVKGDCFFLPNAYGANFHDQLEQLPPYIGMSTEINERKRPQEAKALEADAADKVQQAQQLLALLQQRRK